MKPKFESKPFIDRLSELKDRENSIANRITKLGPAIAQIGPAANELLNQATAIAIDLGRQEIQRVELSLFGNDSKPGGKYSKKDLEGIRQEADGMMVELDKVESQITGLSAEIISLAGSWDIPYIQDTYFRQSVHCLQSNLVALQRDIGDAKRSVSQSMTMNPILVWDSKPDSREYGARTKFECGHCHKLTAIVREIREGRAIVFCPACHYETGKNP